MSTFPPSLENVIQGLKKFPGIGEKTAQRLGFFLLKADREFVSGLSRSLVEMNEKITTCQVCHHITETSPCGICTDPRRNTDVLCIVEEPSDIFIIERTGFNGFYHVLGGILSPLDGIGPDDLNIDSLLVRLSGFEEIILAINAGVEGEATVLYLSRILAAYDVKVSRLARGLPAGSQLEFVDEITLSRSLSERVDVINE